MCCYNTATHFQARNEAALIRRKYLSSWHYANCFIGYVTFFSTTGEWFSTVSKCGFGAVTCTDSPSGYWYMGVLNSLHTFGSSLSWLASRRSSSKLRLYRNISSGTVCKLQCRLSTDSTWRLQRHRGIHFSMSGRRRGGGSGCRCYCNLRIGGWSCGGKRSL